MLRSKTLSRFSVGVLQRLRDQANPEYRLPGFIQQFHLPLGVFGESSGNVRDHVAADAGHFLPGGVVIGKLRAVVVDTCILAMSNAEEEDRHGNGPNVKWADVGPENAQMQVEWIPGAGKDQPRVFTGPFPLPCIWTALACSFNIL